MKQNIEAEKWRTSVVVQALKRPAMNWPTINLNGGEPQPSIGTHNLTHQNPPTTDPSIRTHSLTHPNPPTT